MITYVNTVLVSNKNGETLATAEDLAGKETKAELKPLVGKFVFMNCDPSAQDGTAITDVYSYDENADRFKIGVITSDSFQKVGKDGTVKFVPVISERYGLTFLPGPVNACLIWRKNESLVTIWKPF